MDQPCRGLILYSQGGVVINGTINISAKGSISPNNYPPVVITKAIDKYYKLLTVLSVLKGGTGGNGGNGGRGKDSAGTPIGTPSSGGSGGGGRVLLGGFGGGGGGGCTCLYNSNTANSGGPGGRIPYPDLCNTIRISPNPRLHGGWSAFGAPGLQGAAGSGGTGAISPPSDWAYSGIPGVCYGGGGGGAGAVYGDGTSGNGNDGGYAGGCLIIIAKGNVTIGSTGSILANGGNGGSGGSGSVGGGGGGGGGSGGGVVVILHKGSYVNNGSIQVNGGSGGSGGAGGTYGEAGYPGTGGGVGTISIQQL